MEVSGIEPESESVSERESTARSPDWILKEDVKIRTKSSLFKSADLRGS